VGHRSLVAMMAIWSSLGLARGMRILYSACLCHGLGVAHGGWSCVTGWGRTWVWTVGGADEAGGGKGPRHMMFLGYGSRSSDIGPMLGGALVHGAGIVGGAHAERRCPRWPVWHLRASAGLPAFEHCLEPSF